LKRFAQTGQDFFWPGVNDGLGGGLAFLSANLGSLELLGWAGSAYQYGIMAAHWYWIGAIPRWFPGHCNDALLLHFQNAFGAGYLQLRYGKGASAVSAVSFALMTILNVRRQHVRHGRGDEGRARVEYPLQLVGIVADSGCLRRDGRAVLAIFNEVLQFFLVWFGALLIRSSVL